MSEQRYKVGTVGPGTYYDLEPEVYYSIDACSNSRLSALKRGPKHLQAQLLGTQKTTAAMEFGRAAHLAVLEPERLSENVRVKAGRLNSAAWKEQREEFPNVMLLSENDVAKLYGIAKAVQEYDLSRLLTENTTSTEVSILWNVNNQLCKGRVDALCEKTGIAWDLKVTANVDRRILSNKAWDFGYHRQASFYLDGLSRLGHSIKQFYFVAVEPEPPHQVLVYEYDGDALERGRDELLGLMELYKWHREEDTWQPRETNVVLMGVPGWAALNN